MERPSEDYFSSSSFVTELTAKDFDPVETWKLQNHKCSIVLFYAPWCPYCKAVENVWNELGEMAAFFDVCAFNCEKNKKHLQKIQHDMPELVGGFPTMIIYEKGDPVEKVGTSESERTVATFVKACMRACKSTS